MAKKCDECDDAKAEYTHPQYSGDELCEGCYLNKLEELATDAEGEAEMYRDELRTLEAKIEKRNKRKKKAK